MTFKSMETYLTEDIRENEVGKCWSHTCERLAKQFLANCDAGMSHLNYGYTSWNQNDTSKQSNYR